MWMLLATLLAAQPAAAAPARRCGWLENWTPANWSLVDPDGEWILGVQGGYQAPGMDDMPDMSVRGSVAFNGPHGYSCACMTVTTDRRSHRVTRLFSATPLPIRQCRADPRLRPIEPAVEGDP
jgi:hypothetical protein